MRVRGLTCIPLVGAWHSLGEGSGRDPTAHPRASLTKQVLGTHPGHTVRPAQAATAGEGLVRARPTPHPSLGTAQWVGPGDSLGSTWATAHGPQLAHGVLGGGWRWKGSLAA